MTACLDCLNRDIDVYGCQNCMENGEPVCLYCCLCPEHEEYWGSLCCKHAYNKETYDMDSCPCCVNRCPICSED